MALALYRRYRPDTFDGVIGQDQVTIPLMRALDEGRLTHAYLFSGPRGCGKTSSARILARCVNCAKGPTSHPCGECESCKDLATGGPGSIDVVEIDAASHNGVDDARELRERAGFAPARDRYKIFILDEAHMVTQQGFNALLKIVEEPPEHVMFIFATTEPDKVIGTIRSRTHHYPFRLVPQEVMGPYLETICSKEGITPEPGVLKLAMRAGGGSVRDTLSVLDQLMVGSVGGTITHDAAVALLGFTPEALIGEAVDAVIDRNGEALYGVVHKVVVGGFDPRRFVEDLLARVRDLLVLTLAGDKAESVLSDAAEAEDMDDLHRQAGSLGLSALTGIAEIINATLGAMTGAISPRMRLELLAARLLAAAETGFTSAASQSADGAPAASGATGSASSAAAAASGNRGGFVGASRGGFAGARRNMTTSASVASVQKPVASSAGSATYGQPAAAQPSVSSPVIDAAHDVTHATHGDAVPTDSSSSLPIAQSTQSTRSVQPTADDTRSVDQKWDDAVAALPQDVREYVMRNKVPTVTFDHNAKGLPRLSLTFDKPLSQHAFALAVDAASGRKAASVVLESVRAQFGANAVIAPTAVAANGERVESVKTMSPEALTRVKQQIAMAKAGLAAANLGGARLGSEPKSGKPAGADASDDADDAHRGIPGAFPANDPWANPAPAGSLSPDSDGSAAGGTLDRHEHHVKHVEVPSASDHMDPWAAGGLSSASPSRGYAVQSAQPISDDASALPSETMPAVAEAQPSDDPWNQPMPVDVVAADGGASGSGVMDMHDPWNQPQASSALRSETAHRMTPQPRSSETTPQSAVPPDDPWNQPREQTSAPAEPDHWGQAQQSSEPVQGERADAPVAAAARVAADEDEYSMSDQSLDEANAMDMDALAKMFEVKKVEEFVADDPHNPKNMQPAKKHNDE